MWYAFSIDTLASFNNTILHESCSDEEELEAMTILMDDVEEYIHVPTGYIPDLPVCVPNIVYERPDANDIFDIDDDRYVFEHSSSVARVEGIKIISWGAFRTSTIRGATVACNERVLSSLSLYVTQCLHTDYSQLSDIAKLVVDEITDKLAISNLLGMPEEIIVDDFIGSILVKYSDWSKK